MRNLEIGVYSYARNSGAATADRPALWFFGKSISYRRLFEQIDKTADHLYRLGVRKGTVVTIHLPNCPQAVIAFYAVAKLGGICSMVHALTPSAGLRDNMAFTESKYLITHQLQNECAPENILLIDLSAHMGWVTKTAYRCKNTEKRPEHYIAFESLARMRCEPAPCPKPEELGSECAVYLHSSGSTGKPKTICLSHAALNHCVDNTADFFEQGDMDRQVSLGVLPLFHGFGLAMDVHRNISFGSQLVLMPRWNAKTAVKLIKKHRVTLMVGVPSMYYALLRESSFQGKKIAQLAKCYVGGDNVSPELIDTFDQRVGGGHRMFVGFGLTEATTCNCVATYRHYKIGSSGYPVRNTTIAVLREDGKISAAGEGELLISSPTMMMGYLHDDAATQVTLIHAGGKRWVRTGDSVVIDEGGFLHFKRRIKHIIIHNGYNIYPDQVEEVIRNVANVADACVVGVDDPVLHTQNIRAVVRLAPGETPDRAKAAIRKECLRLLPRYSVPQEIIFMNAFPQNAMGKVDRKELSKP